MLGKKYRRKLLEALTSRFGALKTKVGKFECLGVMHEQNEATLEVWTHQQHYVPQIREIPADKAALLGDDEPADEDMMALFMSLVGAIAWLVLTMPCIRRFPTATDPGSDHGSYSQGQPIASVDQEASVAVGN